jgi:hypothetical protein
MDTYKLLSILNTVLIILCLIAIGVIGYLLWYNRKVFITFENKKIYKPFQEQLQEPAPISTAEMFKVI